MMNVIGVDPGKTGGMATIVNGKLFTVVPFQHRDIETVAGDMAELIRFTEPTHVAIEQVTASPNQGVVSAFTFGRWFEVVRCATQLSGKQYKLVRPQDWQAAIGCYSKGDKQKLYEYAQKLFPEEHKQKMFNKATADAVLIAYYAYQWAIANT